jgi:hypothetical protein
MPPTVDRSLAKLIATKRIVSGSLCLLFGVGLLMAALQHGGPPTVRLGIALLIFFAGGTWTLRTGIILRRELARDLERHAAARSAHASAQNAQ